MTIKCRRDQIREVVPPVATAGEDGSLPERKPSNPAGMWPGEPRDVLDEVHHQADVGALLSVHDSSSLDSPESSDAIAGGSMPRLISISP